jgi:ABC-type dipeptide/oligopeptide/nickel transport system ATPase component
MSLIEVEGLTVHFASQGRTIHAVEDVSFSRWTPAKRWAIVGESGIGQIRDGACAHAPCAHTTRQDCRRAGPV